MQLHRTPLRTQLHRTPLRCHPGVVRCASSPPSFAARRRPSPPTPVNKKNTPLTATFVRRCTDISPLSTMMAKARWVTMMATARRATRTMATVRLAMARQDTTTTMMATGDDDNYDGDGAAGDGATGDDNDDDCDERRRRRR